MKRRALLAAAGTAAVGLAGCLGRPGGAAAEWSHEPGGRVDSVSRGTVFVHETFRGDGDGGVVALEADTGERLWSYGSSHGYSTYTDLTVDDAVYFGLGDDAVGSGAGELYALDRDGTERWTRETGSVYERPRLDEGTLYVGSDDGVVRALDAGDGAVRWRHEVRTDGTGGPPDPTVEEVEDAVYVAAGHVAALDPRSGEVRWRFGGDDTSVRSAAVHDGVAYVGDGYAVRAVEGGEQRWSATFESFPRVAVDDGRVFVRAGPAVVRLDAGDGRRRWSADVDELAGWTVHGDRVYAAGTELYALDADDGTEYWRESVADGPLDRVVASTAGDEGDTDDHGVFVEEEDEAIHRLSPGGEGTWSGEVPGDVRGYVVDDLVYVGSDEGVYALDPE